MTTSFFAYTIFTMACALAPNWAALLIFRLLTGINASSPITVTGGVYADIYSDPATRGRAMAVFMSVSTSRSKLSSAICHRSTFLSVSMNHID
jgi:MFS family permease